MKAEWKVEWMVVMMAELMVSPKAETMVAMTVGRKAG